jgi:hypothetical protein
MIIAKLMGGLGNQMFQYAAARRLAQRTGAELTLDTSFFPGQAKRQFRLDGLRIRGRPATEREIARFFPRGRMARLRRTLGCTLRGRPIPRVVHEPHFHFDPTVLAARDETYLDGYWQSEKYFCDIAAQLREEFAPVRASSAEAAQFDAEIARTEAVSIHVRRGDYVQEAHIAEVHGACPPSYYAEAATYLASRLRAPHFFVFSDDLAWCREHLDLHYPVTFVALREADSDLEELRLMSRCRHHIIANSSFSWWAAWQNPRPDKEVLAPRRWFAAGERDTRDLFPPSWRLL